jgi:hypothetical protein
MQLKDSYSARGYSGDLYAQVKIDLTLPGEYVVLRMPDFLFWKHIGSVPTMAGAVAFVHEDYRELYNSEVIPDDVSYCIVKLSDLVLEFNHDVKFDNYDVKNKFELLEFETGLDKPV